MFKLPDYTGRPPEYVKSSLKFFTYHAEQTLRGKELESANKAIHEKAAELDIDLEENNEEDFS